MKSPASCAREPTRGRGAPRQARRPSSTAGVACCTAARATPAQRPRRPGPQPLQLVAGRGGILQAALIPPTAAAALAVGVGAVCTGGRGGVAAWAGPCMGGGAWRAERPQPRRTEEADGPPRRCRAAGSGRGRCPAGRASCPSSPSRSLVHGASAERGVQEAQRGVEEAEGDAGVSQGRKGPPPLHGQTAGRYGEPEGGGYTRGI